MTRQALTLGTLIVAAAWLGAALLSAAVVAPAAFAVLPSRSLAGALVGRVLPVIFVSGLAFGLAVIVGEIASGGSWRSGRVLAAAAIALSCGIAQLVVSPRIARIRAAIGGPIEALAADDARRVAFGRLHAVSVAWLGVAMLAAAVVLVLTARDARQPH